MMPLPACENIRFLIWEALADLLDAFTFQDSSIKEDDSSSLYGNIKAAEALEAKYAKMTYRPDSFPCAKNGDRLLTTCFEAFIIKGCH